MKDFKHTETARCEMSGSEDCHEFDHGIAGICLCFGNEWGDWEY